MPAIYASKTLDGEGLKKRCALLVPFMSCGARLPVYSLFCAAFFPDKEIFVLVCLYGIGILVALVFGIILYHGDRKKEKDIFVLEVPPYRLPRLSIIWKKAKKEVQAYVKKACGIVLFAMCILWCFSYSPTQHIEDSLLAKGAKQVSFLFEPLGFGNRWECVASLPGGILAKETIVGYFSSLQSTQQKQEHVKLGWEDIKERTTTSISQTLFLSKEEPQEKDTSYIQNLWHDERRNLRAFSFLVYILLKCALHYDTTGTISYVWKKGHAYKYCGNASNSLYRIFLYLPFFLFVLLNVLLYMYWLNKLWLWIDLI